MIPKFRIFDKKKKHFLGDFTMEIDRYGIHVLDEFNYVVDEDDRVLMQSTGLYDKKTKEIYYDDILKCDDGTLLVVDDVRTHSFLDLNMHLGYEVIGNIHEHSHLLESV
ncbi:YopX family protein [Macrococcus psychrotolerans]|uniref:YopX family protein n=1 Tax=Macrococcus psychrotolerans TaxID=3039389 RepID=A0AAU6RCF8_9STAP